MFYREILVSAGNKHQKCNAVRKFKFNIFVQRI